MKRRAFFLHALSPIHAGTGQAVDIVDLPIARMRSTGIPIIPGSSIKGTLRDIKDEAVDGDEEKRGELRAIFGPEAGQVEHAGAIVIGDARLLCLPVRSFKGVFAWVTSPLLLTLASRDLTYEVEPPSVPQLNTSGARVLANSALIYNDHIYLEDLDLPVQPGGQAFTEWANLLCTRIFTQSGEAESFKKRFTLVDDETMAFLWETATQVDARNRIDEKGIVVDGALWYEESLPPETLLIGAVGADKDRAGLGLRADEILNRTFSDLKIIQVGGKATIGRGICRLLVELGV